ncbi:hypothetical protein NY547_09505 [Cnuibacter physcomitrellae]|uniref:hypothetical protein n=1 Tax=Cnuibacter physcomitrellae TaxID=1619308 RepID=UPI0021758FD4|nr:hypothetical protein [Cnuibacter physcomitrellae]MCS5497472.1 hypothetical protein [Cnuibacter physcomitrellae]
MRILHSALKHDVDEEVIRSALQIPMRTVLLDGGLVLLVGADASGRLFEIVVADLEGPDPRVIHAMPLRPAFYRLFDSKKGGRS